MALFLLLNLGTRADQSGWSLEIINKAALAHRQVAKVAAAFAKTTYLDRRRELMEEWPASALGG